MPAVPADPDAGPVRSDAHAATPDGFEGTVTEFLEWLKDQLCYGGVRISDPQPGEMSTDADRLVRRVELVTAGFSSDEHLIGRVDTNLFSWMYWRSTHVGGLFVYEVPVDHFDKTSPQMWLPVETDVFQQIHRAREVIVRTPGGDEYSVFMPHGAALSFAEPDRDICAPSGVLTITPIEPSDPA